MTDVNTLDTAHPIIDLNNAQICGAGVPVMLQQNVHAVLRIVYYYFNGRGRAQLVTQLKEIVT